MFWAVKHGAAKAGGMEMALVFSGKKPEYK